jgi:hypothetical protein
MVLLLGDEFATNTGMYERRRQGGVCDVLWVVVDTGTCIENFDNLFS